MSSPKTDRSNLPGIRRLFQETDLPGNPNKKGQQSMHSVFAAILTALNEERVQPRKPQSPQEMMKVSRGRPDILVALLARAGKEDKLVYPDDDRKGQDNFINLFRRESFAISSAYDTMLAQPTIVDALRNFSFPQELDTMAPLHDPHFSYGHQYRAALQIANIAIEPLRQKLIDPVTRVVRPGEEKELERIDLLAKDVAIEVVLRLARRQGDKNVEEILVNSAFYKEKTHYLQQLDSENPLKRYISKIDAFDTKESDVPVVPEAVENFINAALTLDFSNEKNAEHLKILWGRYQESLRQVVGIRNRIAIRLLVLGVILVKFNQIGNILYGDGTYKPGIKLLIKHLSTKKP